MSYMTVSELIERLKDADPEDIVLIDGSEDYWPIEDTELDFELERPHMIGFILKPGSFPRDAI